MSIFGRKKAEIDPEVEKVATQKDSDDYLLALDIGTEYVKALIAKKSRTDIKIVGVGKAHEAASNMVNGTIADIAGVAKVCEEALVKAEDMANVRAR